MDPFIGEIRYFPYNFAPKGWAACDGAVLTIQQNQALYSLLNVMYGGNRTTNFNLPDLRGRAPIHCGVRPIDNAGFALGTKVGTETVALSASQIPAHTHQLVASGFNPANTADNKSPTGNLTGHNANGSFGAVGSVAIAGLYSESGIAAEPVAMHPGTVQTAGAGTAHQNCAPSLVLMPCIAIQGYYPPRQ